MDPSSQSQARRPEPFIYGALKPNYIRLLTILGSGKSPPCILEHFADDDLPNFHAISYSWGSGSLDASILCNGRHLALTEHLVAALRAVHRVEPTIRLWVDAICINQKNNAEKSVQVKKMATVFGKACKVLAWLGISYDNSELILDEAILLGLVQRMFQIPRRLNLDGLVDEGLPGLKDPLWPALDMLCRRAWFERLWVVQEVALAQNIDVICGNQRVPFDVLVNVAKGMLHLGMIDLAYPALTEGLEIGSGVVKLLYLEETRQSSQYIPLLQMIRQKKVRKRVDRIYGILSLVDQGARDAIRVSYDNEKYTYWYPYIEFASYVIEREPTLSLLSMASSKERPAGLPSWCPNFNSTQPEIFNFGGSSSKYHAGYISRNERKSRVVVMANTNHHIKVPGFRVDRVEEVVDLKFSLSPDFNRDIDSVNEAASFLKWEETCLQSSMGAYESKGVPDAHWRTLVADWTCQLSSEGVLEELCPAPDSFRSAYDDFKQWLIDTRANSARNGQRDQRSVKQFMACISRCQERRFFKTCGNRVGLGPSDTQPGDLICVFYSAAPVFILRTQQKGSVSKLVGDAYVHGLMSLQTVREQGLEAGEDFILC